MKSNEFKKLIKDIVNEEIKRVLPELLKEHNVKSEVRNVVTENVIKSAPVVNSHQPAVKRYVKDPVLNQILNETKVKIPSNDCPYVQSNLSMESTGITMSESIPDISSNMATDPAPLNEQIQDPIKSAVGVEKLFMKDYSKLLKAVEKKTNR